MWIFAIIKLVLLLISLIAIVSYCIRNYCRKRSSTTSIMSIGFANCWLYIVYCKRRNREIVLSTAPVVVTSATHTAPGGYPTGMQTVTVYPTAQATGYQQGIYPQQAPYPVSGQLSTMPMPQMQHQMQPNPIGMNQQVMPPYPIAGPAMNPPSYDSAVGANAYEKQSPYNPGYAAAR